MPILFIPAYVSIYYTQYNPIANLLISLAGPLTNLGVYLVGTFAIRKGLVKGEKAFNVFFLARINKWLFILNLIPIPFSDGYNAMSSFMR